MSAEKGLVLPGADCVCKTHKTKENVCRKGIEDEFNDLFV